MGDYEEVFDPILGKNRAKDIFTGSGLLSINGLTPVAQLLAVASAGSDFNIVSGGATHTFNLPTASATNRGALSSSDWSLFNSKLSNISGQDHSTLNNLDYASAGHTGFEKSLTFSTGLTRAVNTITTNDSQIVHDNLSGFVANEHIDHSGVNINAGGILSGGGDITTSRTITLNQSDVDHSQIANTHNLTTDIDHDQLFNYVAGEHFLQSAITQISAGVGDGLVKSTSGALSTITDNSTNWNTAYSWGDHSVEGYLKNIVEDTTPQLGGDLDTNAFDIKFLDNDKAIFGTGFDFEIYHDTNNTIFRNLLQDKDTIFYVNYGGVDTEFMRLRGSDLFFGVGASSPTTIDGGTFNGIWEFKRDQAAFSMIAVVNNDTSGSGNAGAVFKYDDAVAILSVRDFAVFYGSLNDIDMRLTQNNAWAFRLTSTEAEVRNTKNFRVDDGTLFVNKTTHRVGVGTVTPNEKLEVAGKIRANTNFNVNGTDGVSGSFTTTDGKTVTVTGGIITAIV